MYLVQESGCTVAVLSTVNSTDSVRAISRTLSERWSDVHTYIPQFPSARNVMLTYKKSYSETCCWSVDNEDVESWTAPGAISKELFYQAL